MQLRRLSSPKIFRVSQQAGDRERADGLVPAWRPAGSRPKNSQVQVHVQMQGEKNSMSQFEGKKNSLIWRRASFVFSFFLIQAIHGLNEATMENLGMIIQK